MVEPRNGRPVYVLGAGFSRAIHDRMPLTDDLDDAIRADVDYDLPPLADGMNFEDWLTLLSTPLPFLEGHANTRRRAAAESVTAAIAGELERRADDASAEKIPGWLARLVSLWHAEGAVVITFNYDTLVERAVTSTRLMIDFSSDSPPRRIDGNQIAFPYPATLPDDSLRPTSSSFQLLKLHGSLNWYWAQGDGSTLVRDTDNAQFGRARRANAPDFSGTRTLDRFMIPPVTSKDSYYNVNLVHILWRTAHEAVKSCSRLTVIGYSMPAGDRIAAELLREICPGTPVEIVNYDVGARGDERSPLGRADRLGFTNLRTWTGPSAVADYVATKTQDAALGILEDLDSEEVASDSVVVSHSDRVGGSGHYMTLYGDDGDIPTGVDLPWPAVFTSSMPPNELSLQGLPSGTSSFSLFYNGARLADSTLPFSIRHGDSEYVAIGADRQRMGHWSVIRLKLAPLGD